MKDNEIVDYVVSTLLKDFDALESPVHIAEGGSSRRLATIANSRNKIARTILVFLAFKGDPKFLKLGQSKERDLARIVKNILALDDGKQPLMMRKDGHYRKRRFLVKKSA
ncbi:MAG: hypothetical protein ACREBS_11535 [Nitrososphaerales archaeon]